MANESDSTNPPEIPGLSPGWYTAVIEEYKSLRAEAVTARDAQLSVLRLSIPLLAAVIGLGVTLRNDSFIGAMLLSAVVPAIAVWTFELWIGEAHRSVRAGSVVAAIEARLAKLFEPSGVGPPMGWEMWLRKPAKEDGWPYGVKHSQQQRDSMVRIGVISFLLLVLLIGSVVLGLHFLWHNNYETAMWINIGLVAVGLIAMSVRFVAAVRGLRQRDCSARIDDVWPSS